MTMEKIHYEFVLEATTPIAHHAETFGNTSILMDRKVRQPDGSFVRVPVITGDTMRHGMREAAAYALLDSAGLLGPSSLGEAALRLLFAGGMVTGRGDAGSISLDQYRKMSDLIPSIALFGGCADNRIIPGRLHVDDAQLVCVESKHWLPPWVADWMAAEKIMIDGARAHIEEVQRVRMDPTLDPGKRKLLTADAEELVQARLVASEAGHTSGDAIEIAQSKSTMLPHTFETIVQGSLLYWSVQATCYSDLDRDTLHVALGGFLSSARVGGKRGTGHGHLRVVTARDLAVKRPSEPAEILDLGARMGQVFFEHVKARRDEIKSFLQGVNA
jgi:hypothetical protein